MSSEIKQALKQLRKALHEQREYEMSLRIESAQRIDTVIEKFLPLLPFLMSKLGSSANDQGDIYTGQLLLLTKLVLSLTDDQVAAIQEHLSVEQKNIFLGLWSSITRASHTASANTSRDTSPSAAQATPHTTETEPADPPNAPVRHWFYPSSVIGCGLNIDDLHAEELTCLRHEVTCSGCLAQLRADQEKADTTAGDAQPGQEEISS